MSEVARDRSTEMTSAVGVGEVRPRNHAAVAAMVIGVVLLTLLPLVPAPSPITEAGMGRIGLLLFATLWWVAAPVPLPVTTIAALAWGVLTGVLSVEEAFSADAGGIVWFIIGAFGLSAALEANGFSRRLALWFVNQPLVRGRPLGLLFMLWASAVIASSVMANVVVVVVWLALSSEIYSSLALQKGDQFAETNTMGLAWMANIGGIITPIGTPTNALGIGLIATATGRTVGFLTWSTVGLVAGVTLTLAAFLVVRYIARPDVSVLGTPRAGALLRAQQLALERRTPAQVRVLAWFIVAFVLWCLPDVVRVIAPGLAANRFLGNMDLAVPALLVPVAMCVMPSGRGDGSRLLTWETWARGVGWGMVVFIAGVLALGAALGARSTGIPVFLEQSVQPLVRGLPEYVLVFVLVLSVLAVTAVISNLVTVVAVVPPALAMAMAVDIADPVALGVVLTMCASLDYALPSGTTTNAIVAGTGWIRLGTMARNGFLLSLIQTVILTLVVYPIAKYVLN
jgi:solute carrier family 13 (sodium-dependent dicarboxylate transporter), member 2/3/5